LSPTGSPAIPPNSGGVAQRCRLAGGGSSLPSRRAVAKDQAIGVHQLGLLDDGLLAQTRNSADWSRLGSRTDSSAIDVRLEEELVQHDIQSRTAEIEPAFQSALDATSNQDSMSSQKLQRHGIDEQAGPDRPAEHDQHPEGQQRPEHLGPALGAPISTADTPPAEQGEGDGRVQPEQRRVVLGEQRRVRVAAASRKKQDGRRGPRSRSARRSSRLPHGRKRSEAEPFPLGGSRSIPRLVTLLTRNGAGSCAGSRRRRTTRYSFFRCPPDPDPGPASRELCQSLQRLAERGKILVTAFHSKAGTVARAGGKKAQLELPRGCFLVEPYHRPAPVSSNSTRKPSETPLFRASSKRAAEIAMESALHHIPGFGDFQAGLFTWMAGPSRRPLAQRKRGLAEFTAGRPGSGIEWTTEKKTISRSVRLPPGSRELPAPSGCEQRHNANGTVTSE